MLKGAWRLLALVVVAAADGPTKTVMAQDTTPGRGGMPSRRDTVPIQAPDTTPAWFRDDSSYTTAGLVHLKRVIGVTFRENTSQAARQAAVESVGGRVVGGWRFSPQREGVYAVQVADTVTDAQLDRLVDNLKALPQVKVATPIIGSMVHGPASQGEPSTLDSTQTRSLRRGP